MAVSVREQTRRLRTHIFVGHLREVEYSTDQGSELPINEPASRLSSSHNGAYKVNERANQLRKLHGFIFRCLRYGVGCSNVIVLKGGVQRLKVMERGCKEIREEGSEGRRE